MGNRFTRNIQNVRNIDKLPLNTNEQNDLISDKKGNVYVRNLSSYERITGLKKLEDDFNILQERLKDFDPNNEEVENLIKKINNNKIELEKKIKSIQTEITELPNYGNDIKTLDEKIEKEITTLQKELDNIEIQDYTQDINNINKRIDDLDIKNYDDDIIRLDTKIDALEIPNYDDDINNLDKKIDDLNLSDFITDTQWQPFELLGELETNTAYKKEGENGFDCAYREIKYGDLFTKKIVRFNGNNVNHGDIIAQLPSDFVKNEQTALLRVPLSYMAWVTIYPNGKIKFLLQGDRQNWDRDDFFYGQIEWIE